jgi:apolipoprotein N-acyltransferase
MTTVTSFQGTTRLDNTAVRIGIAIALSALSGVLLLLAYPPYGVWPLMWV